MNTITTLDEENNSLSEIHQLELAAIREKKGYSIEYVASKLHLRVRIIELIENGDFDLLPEPVFVKGYLRAYSKLLGVSPDPFLTLFDNQFTPEKKPERALWQSKRESHKAEHAIRWFTVVFAVGVLVAVGIWWQKNREHQELFSAKETTTDLSLDQTASELKLTDLSKMQSLLSPHTQMTPMESDGA